MCGTRSARILEYGPVNGGGGSCSFALRQCVTQLRTLCQSNCSRSRCVSRLYVPPKFGMGGEKKLGKARVGIRGCRSPIINGTCNFSAQSYAPNAASEPIIASAPWLACQKSSNTAWNCGPTMRRTATMKRTMLVFDFWASGRLTISWGLNLTRAKSNP